MKESENRKALLIGVNRYDNLDKKYQLHKCVEDAESMGGILRKHENEDDNFHTILCKNPKHETIKANIIKVLGRNTEHALIYFSGHGLKGKDGESGYLVGTDYSPENPGVSMQWLFEVLNQSKVPEITLILDCCFAGSMEMSLRENITLLAATQRDDFASEGRKDNSVFTKIMLQGLDGAAMDVFGNITATGLYNLADSLLTPFQQRPVFKSVVTRMTPLRKCITDLSNHELRQLASAQFFQDKSRTIQLYPSDVTVDEMKPLTHRKFALLLKFYRYGLIKCKDQLSIYEAALQSETCQLSPFGKFYWEIINQK